MVVLTGYWRDDFSNRKERKDRKGVDSVRWRGWLVERCLTLDGYGFDDEVILGSRGERLEVLNNCIDLA